MRIPMYQLDAFTDHVFGGNPAAVCLLEDWLPPETMQAIAAENNLSETAFCAPGGGDYGIRWFTPTVEIDLAGHPTLAAAWVILNEIEPARTQLRFTSHKGDTLVVERDGDRLSMNFPALPAGPRAGLEDVAGALGGAPEVVLASRDALAVFASETEVRALSPDIARIAAIDVFGVIANAPGADCDFVSRFFAPGAGVPEDPVTGSAHCTLTPYWAARLGKPILFGRQISRRGGEIFCQDRGERVTIAGRVTPFMQGHITL